jgi:hypothetical protein
VAGITQGFCQEGTGDWRSTVPQYIAREIGRHGGRVLVWNANKAQHTEGRTEDCMFCIPDGKFRSDSFNCAEWFEARRAADLVIVGGSGEYRCRSCVPELVGAKYAQLKDTVTDKPWVGKRTRTVHIPISRLAPVLANQVADFEQLLLDEELVKPMHLSDAEEFMNECRRTPRRKRLVYVARYHSWKGQLDFLRVVDPSLLTGYTVEFFSSKKSGADTVAEMNKVAEEKGISIVAHTEVLTRHELLHTMCGAMGLIHFARTDANPRAVYEGLLAGLPAFITKEARVPSLLGRQAFVQMVSNELDAAEVNAHFGRFMHMLEEREERRLDRRIKAFIKSDLIEDRALRKICGQLGICETHHQR